MDKGGRQGRVFYGWWIVLACAIITGLGGGTFYYGFTNFFNPMVKEFGWSHTATSGAFSLTRLESGLGGPLVGWLVDRYGPRKLLTAGLILISAGYMLASRVNSLWMFYLLFLGFFSLGFASTTGPAQAAVANWFIRKRSRALSLWSLGAGVGGTVIVPFLAWLILQIGWRQTAFWVGITLLVLLLPLTVIIRHRPEQSGLLPDGISATEEQERGVVKSELTLTVKQAFKTSTFWGLALVEAIRAFAGGAVVIHMIPRLISLGIDPLQAASVLAFLTFGSIPGRLISGWLGDFIDKRYLLAIASALLGVMLFAFSRVTSLSLLYLTIFVYGIGYGAGIPTYAALRADFFGRKHYATISGLLGLLSATGGISGPIIAGYIYDTTKSYAAAFNIFTVLYLIAAITYPLVKRPKPLLQPTPQPTSHPG